MLILIFFLYYLLLLGGNPQAAPNPTTLPHVTNLVSPLITRLQRDVVTDVNQCNRRSVWNIVWTCFTTLFACTWVAMHPNIPRPTDGHWKILSRRLGMMLAFMLVPEVILALACMQYFAAQQVAEKFNKSPECMRAASMLNFTTIRIAGVNMAEVARWQEPWTQVHGMFAVMGGFMLCRFDGVPLLTLTPEKFFQYLEEGAIECPRITKEEIWDRSKGDYLAKAIVIIQTSWFVVNCVARRIQKLPITELEMITLAFATLNGFTYIPWWNKPLGVLRPVHVYFKQGYKGPLLAALKNVTAQELYAPLCHSSIKQHLRGIFAIATGARASPSSESESKDRSRQKMYVPTFSGGPFASYKDDMVALAVIFCGFVLGSFFGGIHLAAWSFQFPSEAEKWIWRISSIILAAAPFSTMVLKTLGTEFPILNSGTQAVFFGVVVAYVLARVLLLILPLIAFRSLPPGALTSVEWSLFFPHATS